MSKKNGRLLHSLIKFNYENIYTSKQSEGYRLQAKRSLEMLFTDILKKFQETDRFKNIEIDRKTFSVYKIFKEFTDDINKIYDDSAPDELIVLDFLAGMTDRFVVNAFQELFIPRATV